MVVFRQHFAKRKTGDEDYAGREKRGSSQAQSIGGLCCTPSPLFICVGGLGFQPLHPIWLVHQGGGESWTPSPSPFLSYGAGTLSPLAAWVFGAGAPSPKRPGRLPLAHAGPRDMVDPLVDFRTPPESSRSFWKLPGTIPKKLHLFLEPKIRFPIYKSLPLDHSETPRDVRDLIRDSEQHSVTNVHIPILL